MIDLSMFILVWLLVGWISLSMLRREGILNPRYYWRQICVWPYFFWERFK